MSTIQEIETAIKQLSPSELAALGEWFAELDAQAWDKQFEADVAAGKFNALAEEALSNLRDRQCADL